MLNSDTFMVTQYILDDNYWNMIKSFDEIPWTLILNTVK